MKLENGTVLEVGKKYCFKDPQAVVRPITITAIGREYVLGIDSLAVEHLGRVFEQMWKTSYDWIPYEKESTMNAKKEARRIVKEFWLVNGYDQDKAKEFARVAVRMLISESRGKFYYEVLKEIDKV